MKKKANRIEWAAHMIRMDGGRTVKTIFEGNPGGRRYKGRPKLRWLVWTVRKRTYEGWKLEDGGRRQKIESNELSHFECELTVLFGNNPVVDPIGVTLRTLLSWVVSVVEDRLYELPLLLPGLLALLRGDAPRCCPVSRASGCIPCWGLSPEEVEDDEDSSFA
ncbi:hypothetical protein C0J52_23427 [Blattella germanica]|nr:hypothetical protein C0J52_23427 [Blattella germanica]